MNFLLIGSNNFCIFRLGDNGPTIDVVDNYKYLGVYLDQYLTFGKATTVLSNAAGRALGGMINKYKNMGEMGYIERIRNCLNLWCVR